MRHPSTLSPSLAVTLLLLILPSGCTDDTHPLAATPDEPALATTATEAVPNDLRVMSRNMYLGGNVDLVLGADLGDPLAVVQAAATVWGQVQATRFAERAVALVDEIQQGAPHVVGIQEIPSFLILNGAFGFEGLQDHLEVLMAEIRGRGLPYEVAAVQENVTATMPVAIDPTTFGITRWVRFTDRDAVLVRTDLPVLEVDQGNFQAHIVPGPGIDIRRGWIRISTEWGGVPWHFVNTHLEVQRFAPIQAAQVAELLGGVLPGLEDGITVLMGDLNSDAEGGPGDPSWTPSYDLLRSEGFQDAWEMANPGNPFRGYTCCQTSTLDNPVSELDERIDFILLRPGPGPVGAQRIPGEVKVQILGRSVADWTVPGGLWPSDHAGLLATLRVPAGPFLR